MVSLPPLSHCLIPSFLPTSILSLWISRAPETTSTHIPPSLLFLLSFLPFPFDPIRYLPFQITGNLPPRDSNPTAHFPARLSHLLPLLLLPTIPFNLIPSNPCKPLPPNDPALFPSSLWLPFRFCFLTRSGYHVCGAVVGEGRRWECWWKWGGRCAFWE